MVKNIQVEFLKTCKILNIDNINFPPKIKDIEQFEKDNPDISITIFEYDGFEKIKEDEYKIKERTKINDARVSPFDKDKDTDEIIEISYFTTIKSLLRLFWGSKCDKGLYYCKNCYCSFKSKEKLEKVHTPLCVHNENVLTIMPQKNKNDIVKFKDFHMHWWFWNIYK